MLSLRRMLESNVSTLTRSEIALLRSSFALTTHASTAVKDQTERRKMMLKFSSFSLLFNFISSFVFQICCFSFLFFSVYRLCGVVVRVPGYRSRDPGSISGATRFSEK
jgi:hypothetical protein